MHANAVGIVPRRPESACAPRTAMAPCELSPSVTAADPAWWRPGQTRWPPHAGLAAPAPRRAAWRSGRLLERPVDGAAADAQRPGDLGHGNVLGFVPGPGQPGLLRGEFGGRPPRRPRARAAARATAARSAISSRSNSANAAKMWKTSRPVLVVVSIPSCRDANATPRSASALTVSTRCRSDRPSRSSRHTTSVSPARRYPRHRVSSGRSASFPYAVSVKIFSARRGQRVGLPVQVLGGTGDPGVADTLADERMHRKGS